MKNQDTQNKYRENNQDIVFGTKWFEKHQSKLLWLLNTPVIKVWFRWVLRIKSFDCSLSERIVEIKPNNYTRYLGGSSFKTDFRTHNKYAKRLYHAFKPVWYLIHFWDMTFANQISQQLNFGFDTLTVYPEPGVTLSGFAGEGVATDTWANVRGGAGTEHNDSSTIINIATIDCSTTINQFSTIRRGFALFDTSALTTDATITDAVFSLWARAKNDDNNQSFSIVGSTPASNDVLVNGDYTQCGGTRYATDTDITSITTAQYYDATLNATGLAAVSKTAITKMGCRISGDLDNSAPAWSSAGANRFQTFSANEAGTTNDPKLVVTYTLPSTVFPRMGLLGVGR